VNTGPVPTLQRVVSDDIMPTDKCIGVPCQIRMPRTFEGFIDTDIGAADITADGHGTNEARVPRRKIGRNHHMRIRYGVPAALLAALLTVSLSPASASPAGVCVDDAYHTQRELSRAIRALGRRANVEVEVIGRSSEGTEILAMTLAADPRRHDEKPALLITAGLDGHHLVGTETAMRIASTIATTNRDWLKDVTIYVIPRVNPDGAARTMADDAQRVHIGSIGAIDEDRDGLTNEDPPKDLNGDGIITMMRRLEPTLDDPPTHLADPAEPRLNRPASLGGDPRPTFTIYPEGLDADGDGRIAEDGVDGVDLNRNFVQDWDAFDPTTGPVPLSEPETLALARFVVNRPNIMAAITYGRHDTIVNVPNDKGMGPLGRIPNGLDDEDRALYTEMSEAYRELTGHINAEMVANDGSFHRWLYTHRGIPCFATQVWGCPDTASSDDSSDNAGQAVPEATPDPYVGRWSGDVEVPDVGVLSVSLELKARADDGAIAGMLTTSMFTIAVTGTADASGTFSLTGDIAEDAAISITGTVDGDAMSATATAPDGADVRLDAQRTDRGDDDAPPADTSVADGTPADAAGAAWLSYSDEERDGEGFIEWMSFDHPTLGPVEIGGFTPGFRINPPGDELGALAEAQTAFIGRVIDARPSLNMLGPDVRELGPGIYEVHFAIENTGAMPTRTAVAARAQSTLPTIVEFSPPVDDLLSGQRIQRTWRIAGKGGRSSHDWIVRGEPNSTVTITVRHPQLGSRAMTFALGGDQ